MRNKKYKLSLIVILFFIAFRGNSQPGCPDVDAGPDQTVTCANPCVNLTATALETGATTSYSVSQIPYTPPNPFNTGTPILVSIDDTWSSTINLPFSFCFFGNLYNQVVIGSNEILSFDVAAYAGGYCDWDLTSGTQIPSSILATNCIMGPHQDIDPTNQGAIYWQLIGTAPCRILVVSYYQVPYYGDPNSVMTGYCTNPLYATSQIVLYESTNVIEIYIQNKATCNGWNDGLAIEGIQNSTGTVAFTVPGRNNTVWSATNDAWRFTPNGTPNFSLTWWQGTTQIGTASTITVCPAATTTYTAQVVYDCCAGNQVTVTDDVIVTVNNSIGLSVSPTSTNICGGGSSTFTATCSDPSATFQWTSGSTSNTITVSPTTTTTYTVTATTPACTTTASVTVNVSSSPVLVVNDATVCNGQTATINASGATTYSWNNGSNSSSIVVTPATTTTYTVTGTNANGCSASANAIVTVATQPVATITAVNETCNLSNGTATVNIAGTCVAGFTYQWNTTPAQTGSTAINLPAGSYAVTVSCSGCTASASTTITNSPAPTVSISNFTNASCGYANGSAAASVTGGTSPFVYIWNCTPTQSAQTMTNVLAGTYVVSITDVNGCTAQTSVTISGSPGINTTTSSTQEYCDKGNGTATVNASGSGPCTYTWNTNPPQYTPTATGLSAGGYSVTVNDSNCTKIIPVVVTEILGPTADFSIKPKITTLLDNRVYFTDFSSGVISSWFWDIGDGTTQTVPQFFHEYKNLGTYFVTLIVTDNHGCTDTIMDSVIVKDYSTFYIPNSFTPDDNELNDVFLPKGVNIKEYKMLIYDRWGNQLFSTTDINEGWNGTINNSGTIDEIFPSVYVYKITTRDIDGNLREYIGRVTILR
jgi:gliding motility-associated-like protein